MTLDNKFPSSRAKKIRVRESDKNAFNAFAKAMNMSERVRAKNDQEGRRNFYFLIAECRVKIEEHLKRNSSIKHKIALMIS